MSIAKVFKNIFCRNYVGTDEFGNEYYISRGKDANNKHRRIIEYKTINEPTQIPPMWHAWLHYTSDEIPSKSTQYVWQKKRETNKTGTNEAYKPFLPGKRAKATGDYQSWDN